MGLHIFGISQSPIFSIRVISDEAFAFCSSLVEINLPDSVESIGRKAFMHNSFQNFHVSPLVTSLDISTVMCCESLVSLELSENVSHITDGEFFGGSSFMSLRNIALPLSSCTLANSTIKAINNSF